MSEQQQEQLHLLKELAESSGWKIRQDLLARWLESKEKAKASFLRLGELNKATLEQGKIDGVSEFQAYSDTYVSELKDPQGESEENPSY